MTKYQHLVLMPGMENRMLAGDDGSSKGTPN